MRFRGVSAVECCGAEALMRMATPSLGTVSPAEFIPLAERNGQILELGEWIFKAVVRDLFPLRTALPQNFRVSINISPLQLLSPTFVVMVEEIAHHHPGLLSHLRVEITESALVEERARAAVFRIAAAGYELALDDFGAEYASLQHLTSLPVKVLKLDQSFIRRLTEHHTDRAIVRHVLALAADLGITVIAEGVENPSQAELLTGSGCQFAQGYLWDRPAPDLNRFTRFFDVGP